MQPSKAAAPPRIPEIAALLAWYDRHRRDLPWRARPGARPDPYAVWLSEIMLQQTTVEAVKSRYLRFLGRWSNVHALAAAPVEEVMQAWAGLGYYARARNLHACAQIVAREHAGRFPARVAALRALPGVGPYTAAAISAIAFGHKETAVDANVERVVAGLFAIDERAPKASKAAIRTAAEHMTPEHRAGDFAQAMMDLGAMICTPKRPSCSLCPFGSACRGRADGAPERFPRKRPRARRPQRTGAAFVIRRRDGCVLARRRPPKGLLGGMTEMPGSPWAVAFDMRRALSFAPLEAEYHRLPGEVEHGFTHFVLRLTVFAASIAAMVAAPAGYYWAPAELDDEALPSVMRKVWRHARAAIRPAQGKVDTNL